MRSSLLAARDAVGLGSGTERGAREFDGLSTWERSRFPVVKGLRHLAGDQWIDAALELEASATIAARLQKPPSEVHVPTRIKSAGMDTKTGRTGAFNVQTSVEDIIDLLRVKSGLLCWSVLQLVLNDIRESESRYAAAQKLEPSW